MGMAMIAFNKAQTEDDGAPVTSAVYDETIDNYGGVSGESQMQNQTGEEEFESGIHVVPKSGWMD